MAVCQALLNPKPETRNPQAAHLRGRRSSPSTSMAQSDLRRSPALPCPALPCPALNHPDLFLFFYFTSSQGNVERQEGKAEKRRGGQQQGRAGRGGAGGGGQGQGRAGQARPGQARPDHTRPGQARPGQGRAGQGRAQKEKRMSPPQPGSSGESPNYDALEIVARKPALCAIERQTLNPKPKP